MLFSATAVLQRMSGQNFFIVLKRVGATNWKPIYKSELVGVRNNRDTWAQAGMPVDPTEIEAEFKIEFYQSQKSGKHTNIGHIEFTLAAVQSGETDFQVIDKKGKVDAKYTCQLGNF